MAKVMGATKTGSGKLVCVNCGKFCTTGFVKKGSKLYCCDQCVGEYTGKKGKKANVCEFC
jgi:hypothetical protein